MNKQTTTAKSRNRPIITENRLVVARGDGVEGVSKMGGGEWEVQASRHRMTVSQE